MSLEQRGEVATLTLLQPAITPLFLSQLTATLDRLEDETTARALVIQGQDGVFCRGIELADFQGRPFDIQGFHKWEKAITRMERLSMVTVGAVDGEAIGGGFQLLLACDFRVTTSRSSFQLPELRQGFLPGMATFRLARYVGMGVARRWILGGGVVSPREALEAGMLEEVCAEGELDEAVERVLSRMLPLHPTAHALARRLILESSSATVEEGTGHLLAAQARCIGEPAFAMAVKQRVKP